MVLYLRNFCPTKKITKIFLVCFFFLTVLVQLWFVLSSFSTAWVPCFCVYLAVLASCVTRSSLLPWATFALFFKIKRQYRHGPVCRPMTSLPVGTPIPRPAEQRTTGSLKVRWCVTPQNLPFAFQVVAAIPDPLRFHGNVASACQFLKKKGKRKPSNLPGSRLGRADAAAWSGDGGYLHVAGPDLRARPFQADWEASSQESSFVRMVPKLFLFLTLF